MGGVSGYQGYDYQITVTVWLALELMLSQQDCSSIVIEPASEEDIAANLRISDLEDASAVIKLSNLQVQVKLRQTAHWTESTFRKLLQREEGDTKTKGPSKRISPVELLTADPSIHYLLITNAQVCSNLNDFVVSSVGEDSCATKLHEKITVPNHLSVSEVAKRVGILPQRVPRLLEADIDNILVKKAKVPTTQAPNCRKALIGHVRQRLLKQANSSWSKKEVDDVIEKFGGYPKQHFGNYVPPNNYDDLLKTLLEKNALLLIGPPGVGKTLSAEYICHSQRLVNPPFEIIRENTTPETIRAKLTLPGRYLFFLNDPWGSYRLDQNADRWVNELPRLIEQANPDKRFLITSRSAILNEATNSLIEKTLTDKIQIIDSSHYTPDLRKIILSNGLRDAESWCRDLVSRYETTILNKLTTPLSIDSLTHRIKSANAENDINIDDIIADSLTESLSVTLAREIQQLQWPSAIRSAAVLWTLLEELEDHEQLINLDIELNERKPEQFQLAKLSHWLNKAGWVKDEKTIHPTTLEGLEKVVENEQTTSASALRTLLETVVKHDEALSFKIFQKVKGRKIPVPAHVQIELNTYLLQRVLDSAPATFRRCLSHLSRYSTGKESSVTLARALLPEKPKSEKHTKRKSRFRSVGFDVWTPPAWDRETSSKVSRDPEAKRIGRDFVNHVLPNSMSFFYSGVLTFFRKQLDWDFSNECLGLIQNIESIPNMANVKEITTEALRSLAPPYKTLVDLCLNTLASREEEVDKDSELLQKAEQEELNSAYAAHVLDSPSEQIDTPFSILKIIASHLLRFSQQHWILSRNAPWLYEACLHALKDEHEATSCEPQIIVDLIEGASDMGRARIFAAAGRIKHPSIATALLKFLDPDSRETNQTLLSSYFLITGSAQFVRDIGSLTRDWKFSDLSDLIFDCWSSHEIRGEEYEEAWQESLLKLTRNKAEHLALRLCLEEEQSVQATPEEPSPPKNNIQTILKELARSCQPQLAVIACIELAKLGQPVSDLVERPLQDKNYRVRIQAYHALCLDEKSRHSHEFFEKSLHDVDYRCRVQGIRYFAHQPEFDHQKLFTLIHDKSGPVRLALVDAIGNQSWEDGLPHLLQALEDTWDTADIGVGLNNNSKHSVARAAACALKKFENLLINDNYFCR